MAKEAKNGYIISINRACRILNISKSYYYYEPQRSNDDEIKNALTLLVENHPRRGFQKFFDELRQAGKQWNHKRVYRVYCEMGLNLRKKAKKRIPSREAKMLIQPLLPNESWSIDFMSDATSDGRKFRTFNVLDDFNRQALGIRISRSFPSTKVIKILDDIAMWRGYPKFIRSDNGPEYLSKVFADWAKAHSIIIKYIQPGKPAQNAYIERFNRTYREEVLDLYLFGSLDEAAAITDDWLRNYNYARPHESLERLPPMEFARLHGGTPMEAIPDVTSRHQETLNNSTNNWY